MYVQIFKTIEAKLYKEFPTQNYLKLVHVKKNKRAKMALDRSPKFLRLP